MEIVVLPDIHGRKWWKEIIDDNLNADLFLFLGDYVSTHEGITPKDQIDNLKEILDFKEANNDKVILLRGNHDLQHLGYYWAECSNFFPEVCDWLEEKENHDRFLADTQWIHIYNNIVFSHAGISKHWLEKSKIESIEKINGLKPSKIFGFSPGPDNFFDCYGNSIYQPCTWIRPASLFSDAIDNFDQVVGHTTYDSIWSCTTPNNNVKLTFCDCALKEYLVINNEGYSIKKVPALR